MQKERVYFSNHNFGPGEWGEVSRGEKWVSRDGFIRRRYLFRRGDKSLIVFSPVPWAMFDYNHKPVAPHPGEPRSHRAVWSYLASWDADPLISVLGCAADKEGKVREPLVGKDSGPIQ